MVAPTKSVEAPCGMEKLILAFTKITLLEFAQTTVYFQSISTSTGTRRAAWRLSKPRPVHKWPAHAQHEQGSLDPGSLTAGRNSETNRERGAASTVLRRSPRRRATRHGEAK